MPGPTVSATASSRLVKHLRITITTATGVTLFAAVGGLWAYAEWESRLPSWNTINPVAAYDAWKNRPAPVEATLTLTGNDDGEWSIDGQTLRISLKDESSQESLFKWADDRRILITKLRVFAPGNAPWSSLIRLLYGAPNLTNNPCVTVKTIPAYGKNPQTVSFRPVICEHCSGNGRALVDVEQPTGDAQEYHLTANLAGTGMQAEVGLEELSRMMTGYADRARAAGLISQPRALTLRYHCQDTTSVAEAVTTLNAFVDEPEIEDIGFVVLDSAEEHPGVCRRIPGEIAPRILKSTCAATEPPRPNSHRYRLPPESSVNPLVRRSSTTMQGRRSADNASSPSAPCRRRWRLNASRPCPPNAASTPPSPPSSVWRHCCGRRSCTTNRPHPTTSVRAR